jgi:hypothetical protein
MFLHLAMIHSTVSWGHILAQTQDKLHGLDQWLYVRHMHIEPSIDKAITILRHGKVRHIYNRIYIYNHIYNPKTYILQSFHLAYTHDLYVIVQYKHPQLHINWSIHNCKCFCITRS